MMAQTRAGKAWPAGGSKMDERRSLSRRKLLHTLAGTGVIAAADLAWWDAPYIGPRKARGAGVGWGGSPVMWPAQGGGRGAGTLSVERSRADAHRTDELAGRALQSVAKGFRGADRIRAAGAGASEADQLDRGGKAASTMTGLGTNRLP